LQQKFPAKQGYARLLLLGHDLQQDAIRDVLVIFLIDDRKFDSVDYELTDVGDRYVPALSGIVQPSVWIFPDFPQMSHHISVSRMKRHCRYARKNTDALASTL
jgi:hypothetical protein